MIRKKDAVATKLKTDMLRVCRLHFVFIGVYAIYTIASDGTHLITPTLVFERWAAAALMLVGVSLLWYVVRGRLRHSGYYRHLTYALIALDIAMATFNVYTQRGMAARAVMLFALPIVVSAVMLGRSAIYATAALCTAAYSSAAVKYFVDFFNEGYKAELYIEVGFYCALFFILAAILSLFTYPPGTS